MEPPGLVGSADFHSDTPGSDAMPECYDVTPNRSYHPDVSDP